LNRKVIYIILFFIAVIIPGKKVLAQKTDTIVHINGNVLTGELKKLVYGVVTWKMDGMGTISLEEVKVNTMISKKQFEIKMKNGDSYFGSFAASDKNRKVNIISKDLIRLVDIESIVEAYPIKKSFWMRTSGSFSLGVNYSKGSNVTTLAFSGNMSYRKEKSYITLTWDDNNTYQEDSLSSSKYDIILSWERLLKNDWSTLVSFGLSQNSELGTKLMKGLNLMGTRNIAYNNWNRLYAGAGLNLVQETPYDGSGNTNDLAGVIILYWKVYKYTTPKVWIDANIAFLPYITDSRNRVTFNLNPQVSILSNNFKIGLNFYYNFDSNPPSQTSNDDYGLNLQFTYAFH